MGREVLNGLLLLRGSWVFLLEVVVAVAEVQDYLEAAFDHL